MNDVRPLTDDELIGDLGMLDRAACVVVWDRKQRDHVRRVIRERLGNERASMVTILTIGGRMAAVKSLMGRTGPIFIHAGWFAHARPELRAEVTAQAMAINLRPRPPKLERSTRFD